MDDEGAFQNLSQAIENMKRERDELMLDYKKEKEDFGVLDAQIKKMQMEFDLRVTILKDKEQKLSEYNKMIAETEVTYNRIVETSNKDIIHTRQIQKESGILIYYQNDTKIDIQFCKANQKDQAWIRKKAQEALINDLEKEKEKQEEKKVFQKTFIKTEEYLMAKVTLPAVQMPKETLNKAKKVFSKYDIKDLRIASLKYMRMYQLLHATEKPIAITINQNQLFEDPKNLQALTDKKIIHLFKEGEDKDELWKKASERRKIKDQKLDRIFKAEENAKEFQQYENSLLDYDQAMVVSYLYKKAISSHAVAQRVLRELKQRVPNFDPKTYLDYGSGLSPWSWAVNEIYPDLTTIACVEPNLYMRKLGKFMNADKVKFYESLSNTIELENEKFDLISIAYVLEEIKTPELRFLSLQSLYNKLSDDGFMILACPGSPTGFRFVHDFREWVISLKGHIVAPCQHQLKCPLAKDGFQWCHFDQKYQLWPQDEFQIENEKFSYLIVSKFEVKKEGQQHSRILFPLLRPHKHLIMDLCTTEGKFERRIIPKSYGAEYFEAKHMKWGDLWRYPKRVPPKLLRKNRENIIRSI